MLKKLSDAKSAWLASELVPSDLATWGVNYLNKEKVGYLFDECSQLLFKLKTIDWQAPIALVLSRLDVYVNGIHIYAIETLGQPNPEKKIDDLLSNLQWLIQDARFASTYSSDKIYNNEQELLKLSTQIESSKSVLEKLTTIDTDLTALKNQSTDSSSTIALTQKEVGDAHTAIKKIEENAIKLDDSIKDLCSDAEKNLAQIATSKDEIVKLNKDYKTLHEQLEKQAADSQIIVNTSLEQQGEIKKTIEDASRLGMAGSFRMRKSELVVPMIIWAVCFAVGILAFAIVTVSRILPLLENLYSPDKIFNWKEFIARLSVLTPIIWFTWYSGKQYGFVTRLWEDYAFKYASAMAFEGYKREAKNISDEMLKLLMEVSIINFSSNPLRVYDTKTNYASPLHELSSESNGIIQNLLDYFFSKKKS